MIFLSKYLDGIPRKFGLENKAHLRLMYRILRSAAGDLLAESREKFQHPDDRSIYRDEYRVLDGAARAVHLLLREKSTHARDAARYRWLRDNGHLDKWWSLAGPKNKENNIDADIDCAIREAGISDNNTTTDPAKNS